MGSNNSSPQKTSSERSEMNKYIANQNHQKITTNSEKVFSSSSAAFPVKSDVNEKPLRSILKRTQQVVPPPKPAKMVELYVQSGKEWRVERLKEDELEKRKKELKADKAVKRLYEKPVHDSTYLHFKY